jgi:hypothetical protein
MRWELIIHLLDDLKNDFALVGKAVCQGVERSYKLIFCILSNEKSDLDEVV